MLILQIIGILGYCVILTIATTPNFINIYGHNSFNITSATIQIIIQTIITIGIFQWRKWAAYGLFIFGLGIPIVLAILSLKNTQDWIMFGLDIFALFLWFWAIRRKWRFFV